MEHRTTVARLGALAGLAGLLLTACGGSATPSALPSASIPAGHLLTAAQARRLPEPTITPSPTATGSVSGIVAPSAGPVEREQGPPGNPVATTFADPPSVGRYPYRLVVTGGFGRQQLDFEIEVGDPASVVGGRRQLQRWDIEGAPQEFQYLWTPDRLLLERVKQTGIDGSENECKLEPPAVSAKLPMAVGETWEDDYTCGEATTESSSEIIRTERVTIGETEVDTFVIRTKSTTDARGDTTKDTSLSWYAPAQRLFVLFESESKGSFGTFTIQAEALSLSPATG